MLLRAAVLALSLQDENVGYRILDLKDGERTLTVALWYPTEAEPREYLYGGGPIKKHAAWRDGGGILEKEDARLSRRLRK